MKSFETKSIFFWNVPAVEKGDPARIATALKAAGFGAVLVKAANGNAAFVPSFMAFPFWLRRENVSVEFVNALHAQGIAVIGWGFNYGIDPDGEGRIAAQQVDRLGLDGWVFDVESTFDERPSATGDAGKVIGTYRKTVARRVPTAFCSWAFFENPATGGRWHSRGAADLFMSLCDYGMPMMYWQDMNKWQNWNPAKDAADYFARSLPQWKRYGKGIIPAGRAYTGDAGTGSAVGIKAFAEAAAGNVAGLTWWGMDWAYKSPELWAALAAIPGWNVPTPDPDPVLDPKAPTLESLDARLTAVENQLKLSEGD